MLMLCLIFRAFITSWKAAAANCGPLSEIILSGSPNRLKTSLINRFAVCNAVTVLLQGIRITPCESPWSTTTKIESKLLDSGRSVMKSIVIC